MKQNWLRRSAARAKAWRSAGSGERTLELQSRANERKLAWLRAGVAAAFGLLAAASWVSPGLAGLARYPLRESIWVAAWLTAAIALVGLLRRGWFPVWLPWAVATGDALVLWLATARFRTSAPYALQPLEHPGVVGTLAALAALLVFSGSFRLRRGSALFTTALALAVFASFAVSIRLHAAHSVAILVVLFVIGWLGVEAERGFRRALQEEIERREAQERLRDSEIAVESARRSAEARDQILRVVAHDLRNPLGSVTMAAELLLDSSMGIDLDPRAGKQLEIVRRSARRMDRLIQDLLDVRRIDAGSLPVDLVEGDLTEVAREVFEMFEAFAAKHSIQLTFAGASGPIPVALDRGRLHQALGNLVGNAIKFTPEGGRVTIGVRRGVDGVLLSVADTGEGIAPEQLPRIFEPFWQANGKDGRGLGLGLGITRGIVEAHGGRITVETAPGKGSTFHVVLPALSAGPADQTDVRRGGSPERSGNFLMMPGSPNRGRVVGSS